MSWQVYVDEHLMCVLGDGTKLSSAAIIGLDGTVWANSNTFPELKTEELTAIKRDFEEPGTLAPTGLYVGGTKYMVIQGEDGVVIRGKKDRCGIIIRKTAQALLVGIYEEPMSPGQASTIVERLGDYLFEQGF